MKIVTIDGYQLGMPDNDIITTSQDVKQLKDEAIAANLDGYIAKSSAGTVYDYDYVDEKERIVDGNYILFKKDLTAEELNAQIKDLKAECIRLNGENENLKKDLEYLNRFKDYAKLTEKFIAFATAEKDKMIQAQQAKLDIISNVFKQDN